MQFDLYVIIDIPHPYYGIPARLPAYPSDLLLRYAGAPYGQLGLQNGRNNGFRARK